MRYPTQKFRQRILDADKVTFTFRGRKIRELARLMDAAPSDFVGALVLAASGVRVRDGDGEE